jgi:glycosyltransferase involved in cell wall biosynthesis
MHRPRVSVIIPAYDCAPFIGDSIRSVLDQTFEDLEVIVVDDASTDGTVAEALATNDVRLRLIRHRTNIGVAAAANSGLDAARGEYVAALGSDDRWLPTKLERQVAHLDSDRALDVSYTWSRYIDARDRLLPKIDRNDLGPDPVCTLLTSRRIKLACTMLARRDVRRYCRGLDPRLRSHEDWELLLRMAIAGVTFACIPEPLTLVRKRAGSLSHSHMSARDMRIALANVWQLRRSRPDRIKLGMIGWCYLRSLAWVGECGIRRLLAEARSRVPRRTTPVRLGR